MPSFLRFSLIILSLLAADFIGAAPRSTASQTAPPQSAASPDSSPAAPTDPRALYDALNALRPEGAHVYTVKDLTLRRDVVSFTFTQGKLAFLEPLGGRITGAVFSGRGHVIATPHERGERRSLAQFIGVPILDQPFSDVYIRFSDDTAAELQRQLTQEEDEPSSDPAFNAHWDPLVAGLAPTHSLRILMDWLAADPIPLPKDPALVPKEVPPDIATGLTEIEQLADDVNTAGDAARKVTILGTAANESITLTALTLARLVARNSRVVVVGLSASSSEISAISAASVDPDAPGLAELMLGETSFSHVITKDRSSRVHLVSAGRPGSDRALLQSPRLALAIDALLRVYDHVLLDAGTASDLPAELLTAQARAVVVPDPSMTADARTSMCDQLRAAGCFTELTMLSELVQPSDAMEPGARVVAA